MIYLDNAATTFPKPNIVAECAYNAIKSYGGNPGRGTHKLSMKTSEAVYNVRKKCGEMFNTDLSNIVFTCNCTMSLNMAIKGLIPPKTNILISCFEHNAVLRPVHRLFLSKTNTYQIITPNILSRESIINAFENAITDNTSAIICTHVSNLSGYIMPIEEISDLCRKYNLLFIVDAAQSAGVIPINLGKIKADALCMPGHKGLYGLTGTGIIAVAPNRKISTILEGGTGNLSSSYEQPPLLPERLESGTINTVGILSLGKGIDFINTHGIDIIHEYEYKLANHLYNKLRENKDFTLYQNEFDIKSYAPIVNFNYKDKHSDEVAAILGKHNIAVRGGLHCSPLAHNYHHTEEKGMVRISPSFFNTVNDINQAYDVLVKI